ncbi:MAG TPA: DHH family phosphoesterase, partial [Candidatus Thermoplasmatota archaeon]|nr:DHH family phosphoesterase [Candidatus Thermoplasmatota archaeon]
MDALLARLVEARGRILWLLHVNADPDCVGSAFALREAFGGVAAAPEGMNRPGERLARLLAFDVERIAHPQNFAAVVAVDTGSRSGLGATGARIGDVLLVDHHAYGDLHEAASAKAWDPARASCAEVVLALLDHARVAPSPAAARALLAGVVTD